MLLYGPGSKPNSSAYAYTHDKNKWLMRRTELPISRMLAQAPVCYGNSRVGCFFWIQRATLSYSPKSYGSDYYGQSYYFNLGICWYAGCTHTPPSLAVCDNNSVRRYFSAAAALEISDTKLGSLWTAYLQHHCSSRSSAVSIDAGSWYWESWCNILKSHSYGMEILFSLRHQQSAVVSRK